ncbi:MAG: hypothetical protein SOZ80_08920 [Prevotella sp.]|uniref:hypothetical protein n=1 Tax=Prevotella sp. TaxID=59823 RepID=UPI002A320F86|nr:hypothetical protein [Prevotella sp.]MDD7318233.1 hypothetical protein [Prevotellaceae bacterium]MDY4020878.1 hypothetical protein [Prevotella sp.]
MSTLKIEENIKSRSIPAITAASYRLMSQNITLWTKRLWIWIVCVATAAGIAVAAALMLLSVKSDEAVVTTWCVWAAASLLTLLFTAFVSGGIMAALKGQKTRRNIIRALKLAALVAVVFVADVALFYAVSIPLVLIWHQGMLLLHLLIAIGIVLVTALLLVPTGYSGMKYMAEDNLGIVSVLGRNYFVGLRFYGRMFMTFFVTMLIGTIIAFVLAAPLWVVAVASLQNSLGIYLGDASGMPTSAPLLIFLGTFTAIAAYSPVWLWQFFCLYYQYGSITARRKETRKEVVTEE